MGGRIPEDIIDKVRDEVAIEEVIGHFVPLQRKGSSYWGCCPFHTEKTPSFHVHPERQIFYCFGCQRGGGVFRFLMDKEGMSFPEAVQWCASRIGLDLTRFLESEREGPDPRGPVFEANRWWAEWAAERLNSPAGEAARNYARQRGLHPETIEGFGLGYAPADGRELVESARKADISEEALLAAGILGRKEGRAPFAYFRSRIIFPIRGVAQKIHGFGGRILGPGEPKYLNSPETPVFHKRRTLYALPEARAELVRTRSAILVEGYLDAIALHQAGWKNTIATCGTAFSAEQAQVLRRYVDRMVLVFDGDRAGQKAAYRSADVALGVGLDVRIVRLDGAKDPADLVQSGEEAYLQGAIEQAPGLVVCMAREVEQRGGGRELKERALQHLKSLIAKVEDPIRGELLLQEAAEVFQVPSQILRPGSAQRTGASGAKGGGTPAPVTSELESSLLRSAMASRTARRLLMERIDSTAFGDPSAIEVFELLRDLNEERESIEIADFESASAGAQSLAARLLRERPGEGFDAVAEIQTRLRGWEAQREKDQRQAQTQELDLRYASGDQSWREELRRKAEQLKREDHPTDSDHTAQRGDEPQ